MRSQPRGWLFLRPQRLVNDVRRIGGHGAALGDFAVCEQFISLCKISFSFSTFVKEQQEIDRICINM
jgi:hypothetical protein